MKLIPLTGKDGIGKFAMVDDEDFEHLSQWKWYLHDNRYARRTWSKNGKVTPVMMHRYIMKLTDRNICVDHKDHNGLNCQKSNMRTCTHAENMRNISSRKNSTSKYLGVHWNTKNKRWIAAIYKNDKRYYLGAFKDETQAALAYDKVVVKFHGEFANLNFK